MRTVGRIPITAIFPSCTTSCAIGFLLSLKLIGMFPMFTVGIVFFPLLGITQYFIGFIQLLEFLFCRRVIRIQIGMIFASQFPIGFFYIFLTRIFINA